MLINHRVYNCTMLMEVENDNIDELDRLRRILIRSCSAVPYPLRKWRRLQRRWMLDMSRRLCCRMESEFK